MLQCVYLLLRFSFPAFFLVFISFALLKVTSCLSFVFLCSSDFVHQRLHLSLRCATVYFDPIKLLLQSGCLVLDLATALQDADVLIQGAYLLCFLFNLGLVGRRLSCAFLHLFLRLCYLFSSSLVSVLSISLQLLKIGDLLIFSS